jgi:integrase
MGAVVPVMVPIKRVEPAARADFPVSFSVSPDGSKIVVSRFRDDVWDFYPYIPQESLSLSQKCIDWHARLPDGRSLTDPEHAGLLNSAKAFVWSLFADPVEGRRRPKMLTLVGKTKVLLFLLRWMVDRGLTRFVELDGHTLAYAQAAPNSGGKPVSRSTLEHRLQIVEDIHLQRAKLDDALTVHPWAGESTASLTGVEHRSRSYVPATEPIPDRVAGELARVAIEYVRNRGPVILAARDAKDAALQKKRNSGYGRGTLQETRAAIVHQWGYENAYKLTTALNRLRMSCYVVIALFSGMRESEVMSIGEDCIARRRSRDGSCDVTLLHGTIYKTGMRPKAWQVPPVVEEAVAVLVRLTTPLREALRQEAGELRARIPDTIGKEQARLVRRLAIVERHQDKLFLAKYTQQNNVISVLSGVSIRNELRRFCVDHEIFDDAERPYPLHSHQFRRSYARFMARSELGDLLTLRDHFGHWSLDMTVYYADGASYEYVADRELLEMVAAEKQICQAKVLRDYLESDAPLANGGHWLGQWRSTVRTAPNKEALIAEYAGSITLNGTGHSWCVGNARGTGCGGLCIFEAPMCVECPYGIIGPEHRPVWEGIRDQQREALSLDDMGASGRARAERILDAALAVLRRLDGEVVP